MLDAWAGTATGSPVTHASLHNNIPNDSGSNEIAGGTPAYARKAVSFSPASSGTVSKDATDPVFDVPAGTTVFFVGFWTALTVGTFMGWAPVNGGVVEGYATGADTGDVFTSYGHGLVNNDRVLLRDPAGGSLPGGLSASTLYHVISVTADTFQVSLTQGGAAEAITASSECYFQKVTGESFGAQGTLTFDTGSLTIN
jgi:hypothetical protein